MSKAPYGILLLHGLSSHISCIDPVVPRLAKYNLPYRMPILRGHGTQSSDLQGVKWQDWLEDGQKAFDDLRTECEKIIIVSLSMGSLVGINLAINNPAYCAGLVCIAPALKLKSPLMPLVPVLAKVIPVFKPKPDPKSYFDQAQFETNQNYKEMPSSALVALLRFQQYTRPVARLAKLTVPTLILQTTQDLTVSPQISQFIYDTITSQDKRLVWFHQSGHEMLRDGQREEVLDQIENFIVELTNIGQQSSKQSSIAN